jgi:hypothetical protein
MIIHGQIGAQTQQQSLSPGAQLPVRQGNMGELIQSPLHGKYYESCYRRNIFTVSTQAAGVTVVGLNTAYTGLSLSNPVGSTVNLVILRVGYSFIVAQPTTSSTVGLMCSYNSATNATHTTPVTPRSCFFGVGASPVALADTSSTLPTTPILTHILGTVNTGAITVQTVTPATTVDLEGSLILPPGCSVAFYTTIASAGSSFQGSFTWEEVPI